MLAAALTEGSGFGILRALWRVRGRCFGPAGALVLTAARRALAEVRVARGDPGVVEVIER